MLISNPIPGCIPPAERMLENPSAAGIPHPGSLAGSVGPCGPGPLLSRRLGGVRNPPRSKALGSSFRASPAPSRPSSCLAKLCSTTAAAAVCLKIDGGGCLCKISCFPLPWADSTGCWCEQRRSACVPRRSGQQCSWLGTSAGFRRHSCSRRDGGSNTRYLLPAARLFPPPVLCGWCDSGKGDW